MSFHAIIPAGGAGTRLWPLSRKGHPKFLSDLTGAGRSLLQQTIDRLGDLADEVTVVTGANNAEAVASQVPRAEIVVEPQPRGTMGAIGLVAAIAAVRDRDAVIGSFAADHLIADEEAFRAAVRTAIAAAEAGYVATIGITPDGPSTAYGYIEAGGELDLPEPGRAFGPSGHSAEAGRSDSFGTFGEVGTFNEEGPFGEEGTFGEAGSFGEVGTFGEAGPQASFESEPEYAVETPPPAEYFDDRGHLIGVAFGYNPYVGQAADEWDDADGEAGADDWEAEAATPAERDFLLSDGPRLAGARDVQGDEAPYEQGQVFADSHAAGAMGEDDSWPAPDARHGEHVGGGDVGADADSSGQPSSEPATLVARLAAAFVEKPDEATAASYLATGDYLWNAGMFVAKASVLMEALERFHPELAWPLREIADAWDGPSREAVVSRHWVGMPSLVIDTAVAEPLAREGGIAVVPVEMGWSDIGDYDSLAEAIDEEARTAQVVPGASRQPVIAQSSPDALVYAGRKPIAVVGIPGAVVVDMDDVLLVTTRQAAQQVKGAVDALPGEGLSGLA